MTFELYSDRRGEWRWRLRHGNGNILATASEGYKSKSDAIRCIETVKGSAGAAIREL
jgi:uncharacterized protein YegP (UPF0339 family)